MQNQSQFFGHHCQFLLNKFFDPNTPSLRKVDDGEKKKKMLFIVATNFVASRLPERRPTGTPTARANFLFQP